MSTYRESGVDIGAGDRAVDLMRASIARTGGPLCRDRRCGLSGRRWYRRSRRRGRRKRFAA